MGGSEEVCKVNAETGEFTHDGVTYKVLVVPILLPTFRHRDKVLKKLQHQRELFRVVERAISTYLNEGED